MIAHRHSLAAILLFSVVLRAEAACMAGPPLPGVAVQTPSAEFAVLPNGTAVHMKTSLIWKRCVEGQTWNGSACAGSATLFSWAGALTQSTSASDGGSTQWRVPNRKELESIVEFCGHSPTVNQEVFPGTPYERFWTSTTYLAEANRAWDVSFADGYVGASLKSATQYVRLVRSLTQADYPLPQTVVFGPAPALGYGGSAAISAAATSGLPVTLGVRTPSVCSLSGTTVTVSSAGTCTITGNQAGNASFAPAPEATLDIAIGQVDQTISFGGVPLLTVGGTGTITATASSGLPVTLGNLTAEVCSLTGTTVKGLKVGTCSITANQAGNGNYNPAPQATQNISVSAGSSAGGGQPPSAVPVVVLALVKGWNLTGNGSDTPFNVDDFFGDSTKVESIWKWLRSGSTAGIKYPTWAFRAPALADKGAALAASRGYELLTAVQPGEGFWVNVLTPFAVTLPGAPLPAATLTPLGTARPGQLALGGGWSLATNGEDLSPAQFYNAIGGKASGLVSLWAWDAALGKWLLYAPSLEALGPAGQADYAAKRGLLDFAGSGRRLPPGGGFWIRRP